MKISFDASAILCSSGGGIYSYLVELLPRLARLAENNGDDFRYFYLSFRSSGAPSKVIPEKKIDRIRFPVKLMNRLWLKFSFPDLSWFLKEIDIFHSPHFSLPVIAKAKKILTVNDITYLKHPEYYAQSGKKLNDYGYKQLLPVNIKRADRIIAISHHTKSDLIEYFGIPENKISVIHIGTIIPEQLPEEKLQSIISRFGLEVSEFVYFPVGTFEPRKNIERTIKAFSRVNPKPGNIKLAVSGVGDKSWLDKNTMNNDIVFVRWNKNEERNALYQAAKFAVYPSLYEGFGIPALEALANGKALLTSNNSSLPEIAEGYAHLVDPHSEEEIAEGLESLFKDDNYRRKFEDKAIGRAKEFNFEKMVEETYRVYKS